LIPGKACEATICGRSMMTIVAPILRKICSPNQVLGQVRDMSSGGATLSGSGLT
jgi:hypothetical protein